MKSDGTRTTDDDVTLFLCGDVMTGRGVDQILPHPSDHELFEPCVRDAREYVAMAELRYGPLARPVAAPYIWGDALVELERVQPDVRIANLETSVTACDAPWVGKGINYRMHPENIACLTAARLDVCSLANNHVLDYGWQGFAETIEVLANAGVKPVGAGQTLAEAQAPAIVPLSNGGRVVVIAFAAEDSGVPRELAARGDHPGVHLLTDLSAQTAAAIVQQVRRVGREGDVVVASIHWGSNWGYDVPDTHIRFAHWLVDGGVHVVHGHSSHHPRPIEVYRGGLILYGCGDFIDDYEGIMGYDSYRDDLVLMYFATVSSATGALMACRMTPMQIRQLRVNHTSVTDARWLRDTLHRVSAPHGSRVDLRPDGTLTLGWT